MPARRGEPNFQQPPAIFGDFRFHAGTFPSHRSYSKLYLYFNKLNFTAGALSRTIRSSVETKTRQMSSFNPVAKMIARLTDAFETVAGDLPEPTNVTFIHGQTTAKPAPTALGAGMLP